MAGDAAGQITASLTLDISKFTKALGEAKKAVSDMQKTASQAASSGGGGDAAASSAKKVSEAVKKQASDLKQLSQTFKRLKDDYAQGITTQEQYRKKMQAVVGSANKLKGAINDDAAAYNKFNSVAAGAAKELTRIDEAQKRATASAERLKQKQEAASAAMRKQIKASILPAVEASPAPAAAPSGGIKILPAVDVNVAKEINLISSSYTALNNAVGAGVVSSKKAAVSYKKLARELKKLEPMVEGNQKAVNAYHKALAKQSGTNTFIRDQENARASSNAMAQSIGTSTSKIGGFFKVMGAGMASGSRGMVMSITNLTESFQKGQMGGRQLTTFLMGDVMDAFMIGSFVADGFRKSAAGMGEEMVKQKKLLMGFARAFPFVTAAGTVLLAVLGYLTAQFFKSDEASKKASQSVHKYREALILAEADASSFALTLERVMKNAAGIESIDINKPLLATEALARVTNELDAAELGKHGVMLSQVASSFAEMEAQLQEFEDTAAGANDTLGELYGQRDQSGLGLAEAQKALQEVREGSDAKLLQARYQLKILGEEDANIQGQILSFTESRARAEQNIVNLHAQLLEQISAEQELREKLFYLDQEEEKRKRKQKRDERVQRLLKEFKELETKAKKFRAQIEKVTGEDGFTTGPMAPMLLRDLIDTEDAMKRLVKKGYPELKKAQDGYNQSVHESQFSKVIDAEAEKVKEIEALYKKAAEAKMKLSKASIAQMDKDQRKGVEQDIAGRMKTIDFMGELGVKARHTGDAMNMLAEKGIKGRVLPAFLSLGEGMASFASNIFSGDFSNFYAQIGETLGKAGAQIANLIAPGMGEMLGPVFEAIGTAIGTFFDQMISRIEIPSIADPGKMYGMDEVINAAFEQPLKRVAPIFMQLGEAVHLVASNIGNFFAQIVSALGPTIRMLGNLSSSLFQILFNVLGALMPFIHTIASILNPVSQVISGLLSVLMPIINVYLAMYSAIYSILMIFLQLTSPIGLLLAALPFVAQGLLELGLIFQSVATKIGEVFQAMFHAIANAIYALEDFIRDDLFGGNETFMSQAMRTLGNSMWDLGDNVARAANGMGAFGEPIEETIRKMDEENRLRDKANSQASKVLNAPQGFKVEKYRYEAMSPEQSNPFTGSSLIEKNNTVIKIENINVRDGDDLVETLMRIQEQANRTGSVLP
jgi:hypothetical protein